MHLDRFLAWNLPHNAFERSAHDRPPASYLEICLEYTALNRSWSAR
jgi:hypothetical protein